nr:hypothetical protein [Tanacetum cinerariifolium]
MDLFAFICHTYPTKIRIGERELVEHEVKLLKMTEGRTVPLSPPVTNAPEDSGDSIDKLFDDADQEYSVERGDDVLEETVAKDASESLLPNTSGKSLAALHGVVLEGSAIPSGVTEPLIAASVALVSDVRPLDFISPAADAPVVTVAVTTIVVADLENIRDSTSAGGANEDATNISKLNKPSTLVNSFYASQSLATETMHHIYVPRWKVTNDSILEDPYVYHDLMDRLASPALFAQLHAMDYDQLYSEFNVWVARQVCLGAEVRMWAEHTLERKGELEDKFTEHTVLLPERNAKIAHLKSLLSLKEDVMSEKIVTLESANAAKEAELESISTQVDELTFDLSGSSFLKNSLDSALELFRERMEALQDEQAKILGDRVAELDAWLSEMAIHLEENFILASLPPYPDDDGIQDRLKAGIDHGQASKDLSMIEAYDPFAEAKYIDDVNALGAVDFSLLSELESKKYSCIVENSPLGASTAVFDVEPHNKDHHVVAFEKEELGTSPK